MEKLVCENPEILMNAAAFNLGSWLLVFLFLCITMCVCFTRNYKLIFVTGLTSVLLAYLVLNDQSQAKKTLESGNYDTIIGSVDKISINKQKTNRGVTYETTIELRLSGMVKSKDGEVSQINPKNDIHKIRSQNNRTNNAGKLCKNNSCVLNVGDKVRVLANYNYWHGRITSRSYVPFQIEKCGS